MDKIDLLFIPFIYLFRTTLLLSILAYHMIPTYEPISKCICNTVSWLQFIAIQLSLLLLWLLHSILCHLQCMFPMWQGLQYWPRLFWTLFGPSSQGPSIYTILFHNNSIVDTTRPITKRSIDRHFAQKGKVHIRAMWSKYHVFSCYQTQGAYAHLNQKTNEDVRDALNTAARAQFYDDPLRLSVPYNYLAQALKEPPDGITKRVIAFTGITLIFLWPIIKGTVRLTLCRLTRFFKSTVRRHRRRDRSTWLSQSIINLSRYLSSKTRLLLQHLWRRYQSIVHRHRHRRRRRSRYTPPPPSTDIIALTSDIDAEHMDTDTSFPMDSDGVSFFVDNCATGIISNVRSLFIGRLSPEEVGVGTSDTFITKTRYRGTIRLVIRDDAGTRHTYDIPGAVYDPEANFNLLGVPFLGDYFGRNDEIPNSDDDGTWIKSSANKSHFTWDHGKHERHFVHGDSRLPELLMNEGTSYFRAFCSRISKYFAGNVEFAFSSVFTEEPKPITTAQALRTLYPRRVPDSEGESDFDDQDDTYRRYEPQPLSNSLDKDEPMTSHPTDFELGMSLVYKDGEGNNEAVVYEGASPDGMTHTIRKKDGTKIAVHDSNLQFLLQPDLSNLPSTPLDYCKEVGKGLSLEEAQRLARPRTLSPLQQELMSWHHRLYHLPFNTILMLADRGHLPKRLTQCRNTLPLCIACQFGKAHRRPWRTKGKKSGSIRKPEHKQPGDGVSMDQIVSAQPGLIPQMTGFLTSKRIWGCTTFVDHVTDYVYVHLMRDFTLAETLLAKASWEKLLAQAGHAVTHYHADNGRFADNGFIADINKKDQKLTFCGVGAHHQNGIIENKNKVLTQGARTLLLHGMRMWPQMIDSMFWPFAFKAMAERLNSLQLNSKGETPESLLHGVKVEEIPVKSFHTLFCPIYVLDSRLHQAGGAGPPKWEPRSRIGVYLGHSPFHAGSVALVFNPTTGRVSPQYHVVFDDEFSTVPYMEAGTVPPNWSDLVKYSTERATPEDFDLAETWLSAQPDVTKDQPLSDPFGVVTDHHLADSNASAPIRQESRITTPTPVADSEGDHSSASQPARESSAVSSPAVKARKLNNRDRVRVEHNDFSSPSTTTSTASSSPGQSDELKMPKRINLNESGLRRSERIRNVREDAAAKGRKAHAIYGATTKVLFSLLTLFALTSEFTMPCHSKLSRHATYRDRLMQKYHEVNEHYDGTLNQVHHLSLLTEVSSNEVFTYHQAMKQKDRLAFVEAMEKEVADHESRGHWTIVPRSSLPEGAKAIKAIWSFKRKRYPDGRLNKHKARLCAHGGMQQWGENYWETYSPVVNMMSVRLLLLIAKIHNLDTKAIDFVLAFPQAELDVDIWMQLPIGFQVDGETEADSERHYLLKLNKSLYGLKQASFNWYEKLKTGLMDRELVPSKIDPCLYLGKGMIVLTYVDDCIIIGNSMEKINAFVKTMQKGPENFILTDEGEIDKYLGIEITQLDGKRFQMAQPFLIDRIVSFLGLTDNEFDVATNKRATPVGKPLLHKDLEGKPRKKTWNYRTAVGMYSYLQGNTRPDISMAVHQTARFCNNPMLAHEKAITRLGRYLLHTRDKGIIYSPDETKGLECYVDADFAGGWTQADASDAENVMSRTGFVIMYANCPIYWKSSLQTEIALSTAEAEYIALSQALREVIPLMTLMEEIHEIFPLHISKPNFVCKVHEDNQSCIKMASTDKFTPRTKHIALKFHHFRSHVKSGRIAIQYVRSEEQKADILTKPLPDDLFFPLRYMLCGW